MKLSDLLRDAGTALRIRFADEEAVALRAITPALVEAARACCTLNKTHGYLAFQGEPHECPACRLAVALKAAGVSCE